MGRFAGVGCWSGVGKDVVGKTSVGKGAGHCRWVVGSIVKYQRIRQAESGMNLLKVVKRGGAELCDLMGKMVDTSGAHRGELGCGAEGQKGSR